MALQRLHGPADGERVGEFLGVDHGLPSKITGFHGISRDFNGISMGFQWDNMGHMMVYPPVKEHDHEETCSEK